MPARGDLVREGARALTGVVALAVAVVAVGGAVLLPLPTFSVVPAASVVRPVPTSQQRVCPGPLYELAADSSDATSLTAYGQVHVVAGPGDTSSSALSVPDDSAKGAQGAPLVVSLPATPGAAAPDLAAAQTQTAGSADLSGVAQAACAEPSTDSWLVAGSTTLGQTSLVLLSNPGSVQATVDLTIYGPDGPIDASGAKGILIPPRAQRVVPLSGLAPSVAMPVVHVTALVGQVLASMQQSDVQGIQPDGVDLVGATAAPATQQVISGMTVADATDAASGGGSEGYPVSFPALRVLNTGERPATVRIGIMGESGTTAGNSLTATVQPGQVSEVPLTGLAVGSFTVTIDSDQPVVAAARTTTGSPSAAGDGAASMDFAWFVASQRLDGRFLTAVPATPAGAETALHLANMGRSSEQLTVKGPEGSAQRVTVPAQTAVGIPVSVSGIYTVTAAEDLFASVSVSGPGALGSFAVDPPAPLASPIAVYPR